VLRIDVGRRQEFAPSLLYSRARSCTRLVRSRSRGRGKARRASGAINQFRASSPKSCRPGIFISRRSADLARPAKRPVTDRAASLRIVSELLIDPESRVLSSYPFLLYRRVPARSRIQRRRIRSQPTSPNKLSAPSDVPRKCWRFFRPSSRAGNSSGSFRDLSRKLLDQSSSILLGRIDKPR